MSRSNLKLSIAFDFELEAPEALLARDHENLCRALHEALGAMVLQGMPTVTAKQLGKAGISMVGHHHHLSVATTTVAIPRETLVAAGPHLTDEELIQLERRVQGKLPAAAADRARLLRRQALALVSDFRLLSCVVACELVSGSATRLEGRLNLTNGSVLLAEHERQKRVRLKQGPLNVEIAAAGLLLPAECAGNTLSGPVIEVALARIAAHRDTLLPLWQTTP